MYVAGALAFAALDPPRVENVLASTAGIILECLPYLCASALFAPLLRTRAKTLLAYAGCGCGAGPSARSIPAAIAVAWLFSPWIAIARLITASLVARRGVEPEHSHDISLLSELVSLAPSALLAALAGTLAPDLHVSTLPLLIQILCGCVLGVLASSCALGGVALAASLHTSAPAAGFAVLATAGVVDVRRWLPRFHIDCDDALGYVFVGCACALAAFEGGARLVNPKLSPALFACVPFCAVAAWRGRGSRGTLALAVATALAVVVVIGAPVPDYRATETTLTDAFAGESVDFTGQYVHDKHDAAVERYAITCCRADASPVVLALTLPLHERDGTWVRVTGTLAQSSDELKLRVREIQTIAPPRDPFIYR